jgi:hypothetical protein
VVSMRVPASGPYSGNSTESVSGASPWSRRTCSINPKGRLLVGAAGIGMSADSDQAVAGQVNLCPSIQGLSLAQL